MANPCGLRSRYPQNLTASPHLNIEIGKRSGLPG
jgi:hypothetical protein